MTAILSYVQGNTLRSTYTFTDENGDPVNPDVVYFSYGHGSTKVTFTWTLAVPGSVIVNVSTGVFRASIFMSPYASWFRQWQGILDGNSKNEQIRFNVTKVIQTPVTPS